MNNAANIQLTKSDRLTVSVIIAMDKNRVIGKDNKLPWRLPAEMAYFRKTTMGHPVIMGRKTYESIGKPLAGRENVVMTRDVSYQAEGCIVAHNVDEVLSRYREGEIFVIGGAEVIDLFLPVTDKLYITRIEYEFDGDTFFSEIRDDEWTLVSSTPGTTDEKNPYTYHFLVYVRNERHD